MGFITKFFGRPSAPDTPLHRDPRLERVIDGVLDCCEYALFAGEGAAAMAERVARRRADRDCLACEQKDDVVRAATQRTAKVKNVYLYQQRPREFLLRARNDKPYLQERDVLVVLNVPGGGRDRRFFDEVAFAAETFRAAFLLLLGCRVPDSDEFDHESHRGRECSPANLRPHLKGADATLYVPAYRAPRSRSRKVKGWTLVALGRNASHHFSEEFGSLLAKADAAPPRADVSGGADGTPGS